MIIEPVYAEMETLNQCQINITFLKIIELRYSKSAVFSKVLARYYIFMIKAEREDSDEPWHVGNDVRGWGRVSILSRYIKELS